MSYVGNTEKKLFSPRAKKIGYVGLAILVVFGIYVLGAAGGWWGAIWQPEAPPAPPAEYMTGYAVISFSDPYHGGADVADVDLSILYLNGTNYLTIESGTVFFAPEASYFFAMKAGYWNVSGAVYANGTSPAEAYDQTYSIYEIPLESSINFTIIAIDGSYGVYTASDIPDGTHTIKIAFNSPDSAWGPTAFTPPMYVPVGSYADAYNVTISSLWIGWDGAIEDYQFLGSPPSAFQVYDVGLYNTTKVYALHYSGEYTITAKFQGISGAVLYYGLLDPSLNYSARAF